MTYSQRDLEESLQEALVQFPAVLVTGPRQAGKSTLLQHTLSGHRYVTLDGAIERAMARNDPELFLDSYPDPVIIDEIRYAPELLSYIKIRIDQDRSLKGRFVLTGSQIFQLMKGVTESLAGRIAIFHLYPFSWREVCRARPEIQTRESIVAADITACGFYPELHENPSLDAARWYSSYITTYLERDVRNIKNIPDLGLFERFLGLLAARAGNLLNLSEVAKECGITHPTARSWLSILESTYTIYLLRPYFRNRTKQIVKSPKLYFVDTGLLSALLNIGTGERLLHAREGGALFENMVTMEWVKRESLRTARPSLFFYRDLKGTEVDLIVDRPGGMLAFEIKMAKSITAKMAEPLTKFLQEHPESTGYLLSLRNEPLRLTKEVEALHWSQGPFVTLDE